MLFEKPRSKTVIALAGLTLGLFIMVIPLPELENPARVQLALTFAALSFWASGVVPASITGMLYMGLLLITGSSDALTVFSGWTSEGGSLWLVLCAFLIASGVKKSGLARRAALSICASGHVKDYRSLIAAIAVIELAFALIIPSASQELLSYSRSLKKYAKKTTCPRWIPLRCISRASRSRYPQRSFF